MEALDNILKDKTSNLSPGETEDVKNTSLSKVFNMI